MRRFLLQSRYIPLIGVFFSLIISLSVFINGAVRTVKETWLLISHGGHDSGYEIRMIGVMDDFLIGTGFLVFALGLYEIFVKPLSLPPALTFKTLHEVKVSLSNIIVLTMAVTFLGKLESFENPQEALLFGLAVAIVSLALIAFRKV